jgi:hypothetical protein
VTVTEAVSGTQVVPFQMSASPATGAALTVSTSCRELIEQLFRDAQVNPAALDGTQFVPSHAKTLPTAGGFDVVLTSMRASIVQTLMLAQLKALDGPGYQRVPFHVRTEFTNGTIDAVSTSCKALIEQKINRPHKGAGTQFVPDHSKIYCETGVTVVVSTSDNCVMEHVLRDAQVNPVTAVKSDTAHGTLTTVLTQTLPSVPVKVAPSDELQTHGSPTVGVAPEKLPQQLAILSFLFYFAINANPVPSPFHCRS